MRSSARLPRRHLALLLAVVAARSAAAQSVRDDFSVQATQSKPANPRAGYSSNRLALELTAEEGVSAQLGLAYTHDEAVAPPTGVPFGSSGADIFALFATFDWEVTDRLALSGDVAVSPTSTETFATSVQFSKNGTPLDAQLQASTFTVQVTLGFDLVIDPVEVTGQGSIWDGSLALATYDITQRLTRLQQRDGTVVSGSELRKQCSGATDPGVVRRCNVLLPALDGLPVTLHQFVIGTGGTMLVSPTVELAVHGEVYLYDHDPDSLGFFGQLGAGRGVPGVAVGAVPLAPLEMSVRPEVGWHAGAWSVSTWYQLGLYVNGDGSSHGLGARTTFRVSKAWTLFLSASLTLDLLRVPESSSTLSGWLSLGVRARF